MQIRRWSSFRAAQRKLGGVELLVLEHELIEWTLGLVAAELAGEVREYVAAIDTVGRVVLPSFVLIVRLALDPGGRPSTLTLIAVKRREE